MGLYQVLDTVGTVSKDAYSRCVRYCVDSSNRASLEKAIKTEGAYEALEYQCELSTVMDSVRMKELRELLHK